MRPLRLLCLLAVLRAAPAVAEPPPYWSAAALRADVAAAGPNPFAWAAPALEAPPAPPRPTGAVPANVAHLALRRPYVFDAPDAPNVERLRLTVPNPFLTEPPPAPPLPKPDAAMAADTYRAWVVTATPGPWDALAVAWEQDAIAVRRQFREETRQDWPVTTASGPRAEANRLAAARWVRDRWASAARRALQGMKQDLGLRGTVVLAGLVNAALVAAPAGEAVGGVMPHIAPRVTEDPDVNRYGVGFLVRLSWDLGQRIPFPALDLSGAPGGWAEYWLDDAARCGIQGLALAAPAEPPVRTAMDALGAANIYLPPPSEVGLLVSTDTATLEPGAWVATFRAYAALRAAGVWPDFVSDRQLQSRAVSLARFRVLVVPAARWAGRDLQALVAACAERGGSVVVSDPWAFSRAEDGWDTSARARDLFGTAADLDRVVGPLEIRTRDVGQGRIIVLSRPLETRFGPPASFWKDLARRHEIPARPWLEAVTAANIRRITGAYSRPEG